MQPELVRGALRAAWHMGAIEWREGTLPSTLARMRERRGLAFARDWSFAELLEHAARSHGQKPFLEYDHDAHSFCAMNARANRVARRLRAVGIGEGTGVALMLSNHPRFLDAFFALNKLGAYAVPVNVGLVGTGLAHVLGHSEVRAVVCDHETAARVATLRTPRIEHIWVNDAEAPEGWIAPEGTRRFSELERGTVADADDLGYQASPDTPALLLYTSGTTGPAKAVVTAHGESRVKAAGLLANLLYQRDDKLFSCLPLFHANALLVAVLPALWKGIPLHLTKRFRASTFWREVAECGATQLNTIGGMIPILLKTPPSPFDRAHRVRRIISAACPKEAWQRFEARFGVKLWEAYGAVDGGGVAIFNAGDGPIGSIGRLPKTTRWRLVGDDGNDVVRGRAGELWVEVREERAVRYWRDEKATREKVVDGWLHTGDLMTADEDGHLHFVGRNTDSVRRRGENVSAWEVEQVVGSHPDVLECAAFGVPSPVGEQDIMVSVVPVEGRSFDPASLVSLMREKLPKYAVPAFLDVVAELPKTPTHRVIKGELARRGVTEATIRIEERRGRADA